MAETTPTTSAPPIAGPRVQTTQQLTPPQHPDPASITPERLAAARSSPEYRNGKLTRAGMEHVIRAGGSVSLSTWGNVQDDDGKTRRVVTGTRQITRVEDLPTEADLAEGDAQATAAVLERLDAQQRELDRQRQQLQAAAKQPAKK